MYLEARAEQTSHVLTQISSPPAIPPSLCFNTTKCEHGFDQDQMLRSQNGSVNTSNNCDIQVRVEQSVVMNTELEGGESLEREIYVSANSAWDRDYAV